MTYQLDDVLITDSKTTLGSGMTLMTIAIQLIDSQGCGADLLGVATLLFDAAGDLEEFIGFDGFGYVSVVCPAIYDEIIGYQNGDRLI